MSFLASTRTVLEFLSIFKMALAKSYKLVYDDTFDFTTSEMINLIDYLV